MFCKGKQASILKHSSLKLKSLTFFMRFYLIMQLTPVFLSGKSHGLRSLAGYSPRGHKSQTQLSEDSEESHQFNDGPPIDAPHHAYSVFSVTHGTLHGAEAMITKCFTSFLHTFRPLEVEWNSTQCELKWCVLILDWAKACVGFSTLFFLHGESGDQCLQSVAPGWWGLSHMDSWVSNEAETICTPSAHLLLMHHKQEINFCFKAVVGGGSLF